MHTSSKSWGISLLAVCGALLSALPAAADDDASDRLTHEVKQGETLTGIAAQHELSVSQLLEQNPGLDPDHIRAGQQIVLDDRKTRVRYTIHEGDTLTAIAKRHRVRVAEIVAWNPALRPDHIRAGQTLVLWSDRPRSRSESVGTPSDGSLMHARNLPKHPGFVIRTRARAFGTDETVDNLLSAVTALRKRDPRAPRLGVHDLSLKHGGPIDDHRSHQSGRDADLAYYQRNCKKGVCKFRHVAPEELDVERTWELLHYWLARDELESVFIDYRLQPALYRHARAQGATREELQRWFQYPNGASYPLGVIRHARNHRNHMHVRFACHHSDDECKSFRPILTAQAQAAQRAR